MPLSLSAMLALFNDNTSGDISAGDGRDVITGLYEWGAPVFADTPDTSTDISSVTDVQCFTTNVTGIVAGDIIEVELWGFSNNATGGGRTYTYTLDFDGAFDLEWAWNSTVPVEAINMFARCSVIATNDATVNIVGLQSVQSSAGSMSLLTGNQSKSGYDVTTQDLTGTTAVTLHARADSAAAGSTLNLLGVIIRKVQST